MPVILDDGTYDDRAQSYFLLCLAVECAGWAYLAISCWPGYFRVRLMVCKAKPFKAAAPWLVLAQAVTASLGLLVLGPWTTEIVSAAPTYFAGLRDLGGTKLAKYEAWHALTEACIFGYAAYTVASTTKPTCDQRLVKTLLEMVRKPPLLNAPFSESSAALGSFPGRHTYTPIRPTYPYSTQRGVLTSAGQKKHAFSFSNRDRCMRKLRT
mmetsp:Transcript_46533/g.105161  ORF Transcript_46533/g.105161 Transcript_46533/m.105161 type:complete len:210 (+) Transcript_46533:131-760(+)